MSSVLTCIINVHVYMICFLDSDIFNVECFPTLASFKEYSLNCTLKTLFFLATVVFSFISNKLAYSVSLYLNRIIGHLILHVSSTVIMAYTSNLSIL